MAPRRKSVGVSRVPTISVSHKENVYLRSLSDYQARVRRRETIRHNKNVAEHDLERKIELEIKMREGSSRLLAAARHPAQTLEAARALLTSNERMSAYMTELQHRKRQSPTKQSVSGCKGRLSISDLRFPLMWRDSDHFKNRGDHRRFAVFCLVRVGTEIHDTSLLCPVDREQTDISFPDVIVFNNVSAEFELVLEVYSHILQEDLSIASTPRRIRRSIHSSISKTVGKKLAVSLRDELDSSKTCGPRFDLVAHARMTLDDTDAHTRTHDLVLSNFDNKQRALPLFGHFCCRLAVQPDCIEQQFCSGNVRLNDRYCWARLQGFRLDVWEPKDCTQDWRQEDAFYTIPVNKDTTIVRPNSTSNEFQIVNRIHDTEERRDSVRLDSCEEAEKWYSHVLARVNDHSRWKHAALVLQQIPCAESTRNSFVNDKRQGSLYDETPLVVGTGSSTDTSPIRSATREGFCSASAINAAGYPASLDPSADMTDVTDAVSTAPTRSSSSTARRKFSGITLKSHWTFSNKNH